MEEATPSLTSGIRQTVSFAAFLSIAGLIGFDLWEDWQAGGDAAHLGLEGVAMMVALVGATGLAWSLLGAWMRAQQELARARLQVEAARERESQSAAEARRWRGEADALLRGLGQAIDEQFQRWELTDAEREVALLLLKGLSTKEVADLRETSDRTVRQQARAIYAKGGLAGRAELAAFFLEDLLLPIQRTGEVPDP